jgi:hypothetical protein
VPYQGRIAANGVNFTGSGQFKFAVYQQTPGNPGSASLLWTNAAGTATGAPAEPAAAVALPVANGLFSMGLGDTTVSGMAALPASLAPAVGQRAYIRVWFSTTGAAGSFQLLSPDTELRSVPFAREAARALTVAGIAANSGGAIGSFSTAMGDSTTASGNYSIASGLGSVASGVGSIAMGDHNNAIGIGSIALGSHTIANEFSEAVTGSYNVSAPGALFVIGNGSSDATRANALVVLNSGATTINGRLQVNAIDGQSTTGTGPNTGVYPHSAAAGATVPLTGAGSRLEFLPGYSALRAGTTTGAQWDAANIGTYSTAFGHNTTANGYIATAFGSSTTASGIVATAFGSGTIASGICSTAMGGSTSARSYIETAIGLYNTDYTPASAAAWAAADRLFVVGNGTSEAARSDALLVYKNAVFVSQGIGPVSETQNAVTATVPVSGTGTRMMFIPGYSAFRAGTVDDAQWDAGQIGTYSTAFGLSTTASGIGSTALGYGSIASGNYSVAMGTGATAVGYASIASGYLSKASGYGSVALGSSNATGYGSTALGSSAASGRYSTAMCGSNAASYGETALGIFNTQAVAPNAGTWVSTDRLLVVGNGSYGAASDALVMLKNGHTTFSSSVYAASFITTSDRNRKTDIVAADTAAVLAGVAALPIAT